MVLARLIGSIQICQNSVLQVFYTNRKKKIKPMPVVHRGLPYSAQVQLTKPVCLGGECGQFTYMILWEREREIKGEKEKERDRERAHLNVGYRRGERSVPAADIGRPGRHWHEGLRGRRHPQNNRTGHLHG